MNFKSKLFCRSVHAAVIVVSLLIAPALSGGDKSERDGNRGRNAAEASSSAASSLFARNAKHLWSANAGGWAGIVESAPVAVMPGNGGAFAFVGLLLASVAAGTRKGRRNLAALITD